MVKSYCVKEKKKLNAYQVVNDMLKLKMVEP